MVFGDANGLDIADLLSGEDGPVKSFGGAGTAPTAPTAPTDPTDPVDGVGINVAMPATPTTPTQPATPAAVEDLNVSDKDKIIDTPVCEGIDCDPAPAPARSVVASRFLERQLLHVAG